MVKTENELRVIVYSADRRRCVGRVTQTFFEGRSAALHVEFPPNVVPGLVVGQVTGLLIAGGALDLALKIPARVTFESKDDSHRFQFQVGLEEGTIIDLSMNRRAAVRVRPAATAPVRVEIAERETGVRGDALIHDISATGVGLQLGSASKKAFCTLWRLDLYLVLPGDEDPLHFVGDVRYRRLRGAAIHCGVEFDQAATEDFPIKQRRVFAYVMRRQSELLANLRVERKAGARS